MARPTKAQTSARQRWARHRAASTMVRMAQGVQSTPATTMLQGVQRISATTMPQGVQRTPASPQRQGLIVLPERLAAKLDMRTAIAPTPLQRGGIMILPQREGMRLIMHRLIARANMPGSQAEQQRYHLPLQPHCRERVSGPYSAAS